MITTGIDVGSSAVKVVVMDHPHYKLIAKGAKKTVEFKLEGVPPGTYKLRVWCEKYFAKKKHKFNRAIEVTVVADQEAKVKLKP